METQIRLAEGTDDWAWLAALWHEAWGGETMVSRGRIHRLEDQTALIALDEDKRIGAATYDVRGDEWEVTSLNAIVEGRGAGTALLSVIESAAEAAGATRVWLITTNDNLHALGFYQRRGFRLVAVHPGAVDEARKRKPSIPDIGNDGIPLHDEIELENRFD